MSDGQRSRIALLTEFRALASHRTSIREETATYSRRSRQPPGGVNARIIQMA